MQHIHRTLRLGLKHKICYLKPNKKLTKINKNKTNFNNLHKSNGLYKTIWYMKTKTYFIFQKGHASNHASHESCPVADDNHSISQSIDLEPQFFPNAVITRTGASKNE